MDHPDEGWCSEGYALDDGCFEVECEGDEDERRQRREELYDARRVKTAEKRRFKNAVAAEVAKALKGAGIAQKPKDEPRGAKVEVSCKCCGDKFMARVADRKRGWAKFCSKSCKAKWQFRH